MKNKNWLIERIAIIGLGSIGRRHLRIIRELRPDIEITLVRSGKGKKWPELELADRVVYSLSDAIKLGIQAAIVSSPSTEHILQSIELAKSGIHFLVEKPLSNKLNGTTKLLNLVNKKKVTAIIGYVLRHDSAAQKFYELIQGGKLGKILNVRIEAGSYLPKWRPKQDYHNTVSASPKIGGGVLLELSHEIDYAHWFFGADTVNFAYIYNSGTLELEVEESADLLITSKENFPISVHLDFHRRHATRYCQAHGVNGDLLWDVLEKKVIFSPLKEKKLEFLFESDTEDIYRKQLIHFFDCIENGTKPKVTINEGILVMRMIEQAKKSSMKI